MRLLSCVTTTAASQLLRIVYEGDRLSSNSYVLLPYCCRYSCRDRIPANPIGVRLIAETLAQTIVLRYIYYVELSVWEG